MSEKSLSSLYRYFYNYYWHYIHYLANNYPNKPNQQDKRTINQFIELMVSNRGQLCPQCREDLSEFVKNHPIDKHNNRRISVFKYFFELHNYVNRKLSKHEFNLADALEIYSQRHWQTELTKFGIDIIALFKQRKIGEFFDQLLEIKRAIIESEIDYKPTRNRQARLTAARKQNRYSAFLAGGGTAGPVRSPHNPGGIASPHSPPVGGHAAGPLRSPHSPPAIPKVQSPKVQSPKVQSPRVQSPKVQSPKVQSPRVQSPKVQSPKVQSPKVQSPKVQSPKVVPQESAPPGFLLLTAKTTKPFRKTLIDTPLPSPLSKAKKAKSQKIEGNKVSRTAGGLWGERSGPAACPPPAGGLWGKQSSPACPPPAGGSWGAAWPPEVAEYIDYLTSPDTLITGVSMSVAQATGQQGQLAVELAIRSVTETLQPGPQLSCTDSVDIQDIQQGLGGTSGTINFEFSEPVHTDGQAFYISVVQTVNQSKTAEHNAKIDIAVSPSSINRAVIILDDNTTVDYRTSNGTNQALSLGLRPIVISQPQKQQRGQTRPKRKKRRIADGAKAKLQLKITTRNVSHPTASDGSLELSASGGAPPYHFCFESGAPTTANLFGGLTSGCYQVGVRDSRGAEIRQKTVIGIVCFGQDTWIETDTGKTRVDKLTQRDKIRGQPLTTVGKSQLPVGSQIVTLLPGALAPNVPDRQITVTANYRVCVPRHGLVRADRLVRLLHGKRVRLETIRKPMEVYNILLTGYKTLVVNGLEIDNIHPDSANAREQFMGRMK